MRRSVRTVSFEVTASPADFVVLLVSALSSEDRAAMVEELKKMQAACE